MASRPGPDDGKYWQRYWAETDEVSAMLGGVRQRDALAAHWRKFFGSSPAAAGRPLLEVACGAAPVLGLQAAAGRAGNLAVCTDLSEAAIAVARASAPALQAVVCSGSALPFRPRSFGMAVSQFGIEYAGMDGFAAAAAALAPGGVLAFVAHMHRGAIYRECADNAQILATAESSGVLERLGAALKASYAPLDSRPARRSASAADEAFAAAWRTLTARLAASAPSVARDLLGRYLKDMATIAERRRAYAPQEALAWVTGVADRLRDYRGRMSAMTAAALDEGAIDALGALFERDGLTGFTSAPLIFGDAATPAAWWITARRP